MIVVAIIAVLAIVVIPSFMKETRRAGAQSEVHPMFSELSSRLDQYKLESSTGYEAMDACPPSATTDGTDMGSAACSTTAGNPWIKLRVQAPTDPLAQLRDALAPLQQNTAARPRRRKAAASSPNDTDSSTYLGALL